jgi:hypothetical protein
MKIGRLARIYRGEHIYTEHMPYCIGVYFSETTSGMPLRKLDFYIYPSLFVSRRLKSVLYQVQFYVGLF